VSPHEIIPPIMPGGFPLMYVSFVEPFEIALIVCGGGGFGVVHECAVYKSPRRPARTLFTYTGPPAPGVIVVSGVAG